MSLALAPKPQHIPDDLVVNFDIYDFPIENAEYQAALKRLNDNNAPDLLWTPYNGGHWIATRASTIHDVLNKNDTFSSRQITVPKRDESSPLLKPIQSDQPDHAKYRALLADSLSPKAVAILGEDARRLTIELIEGFKHRGECEFISEFAQHLPVAIFMKIVDLPDSDRAHLTEMSEKSMRGETEEIRNAAFQAIGAYGMQKVIERRNNPGNDLISTIASAKIDGELLDDFTLTGMITLLLMAGLDTVASTLGFFARFLALNPAHRHQLIADPSLNQNAVEELLRRFPVAILGRVVRKDTEFAGVAIKEGEMVVAPTQLYGLDERKFPEPLSVDFNRHKPIHATFGGGVHRCMGSMLARVELRIFLEEWLPRIPDFAIKPGAQIKVSARSVATLTELPLVWDPASVK